jgi:hypothetical protein
MEFNPSGMPSWKGIMEDDEMWKVVRYMRRLPEKGSLGIPELFLKRKKNSTRKWNPTAVSTSAQGGHQHHH